jgi:HlyD family secretion protein
MKRWIRVAVAATVVIGAAVAFAAFYTPGEASTADSAHVLVTRGDITDRALAVGTIEPRVQISVKSQLSGVVSRQFADVGDFVREGAPLLEIRPTPTPQEIVNATRQIELRQLELDKAEREFARQQELHERRLISNQEIEGVTQQRDQARLQLQMERERLELLRSGRIAADGEVATVVRAPITGYIIEKSIEIGDPVVPLTSYQEGTVLMTMANMGDLLFRGTVDEIDVGRLSEGMHAELRIGALPNAKVEGTVARIWLKGRRQENANVFPVEIALSPGSADENGIPVTLRAGYSANAAVIVRQSRDVLIIPERVVTFDNGTARVNVLLEDGTTEERQIRTGLSDAIHVEVLEGLAEGDRVAEKEVVQIR